MTLTFVYRSYRAHVNHALPVDVEYLGNRYRDRGLVPKDNQSEMTDGESNGHVTDDVA